jgi:TetR/AcrR family acrAB operon transcriptional repressor
LVRRTKEDALATRHKLLDAAEILFLAKGVSQTSLQDIAREAQATRGAVYWHFKDKADLFNAMMDRVTMPLEASLEFLAHDEPAKPLAHICSATRQALLRIATDPQTRRVFEVATLKVEYIDELQAIRQRHLRVRDSFLEQIERSLRSAALGQTTALRLPPTAAAQGLHALIDGLIQNWLLDKDAFDLVEVGEQVMLVYLTGLGLKPEARSPKPAQ